MDSILKYATAEEIESIRAIGKLEANARAEATRLTQRQWAARNEIRERMQIRPNNLLAAARAYADGSAAPAHVPQTTAEGPTLQQLQDAEQGLKQLIAQANEMAQNHAGDFNAAKARLIRVCVERCAEDYKRQAHDLVTSCLLLASAAATVDMSLWSPDTYRALHIPRNTMLHAFAIGGSEAGLARQVLAEGVNITAWLPAEQNRLATDVKNTFG